MLRLGELGTWAFEPLEFYFLICRVRGGIERSGSRHINLSGIARAFAYGLWRGRSLVPARHAKLWAEQIRIGWPGLVGPGGFKSPGQLF